MYQPDQTDARIGLSLVLDYLLFREQTRSTVSTFTFQRMRQTHLKRSSALDRSAVSTLLESQPITSVSLESNWGT